MHPKSICSSSQWENQKEFKYQLHSILPHYHQSPPFTVSVHNSPQVPLHDRDNANMYYAWNSPHVSSLPLDELTDYFLLPPLPKKQMLALHSQPIVTQDPG